MQQIFLRNLFLGSMLCISCSVDAAGVQLEFPPPQVSNLSFTLNDIRPAKQRKNGMEAFSTGNCAYSSNRVGDDLLKPSRVDLVAERLQRDFSTQLAGKTVFIENFVIHRNFGKQARDVLRSTQTNVAVTVDGTPNIGLSALGSAVAGSVNRAMADAAPMSCAPDDLRGGYSPEETPNDVAPIVIVIDLKIDNTQLHVRTVYEPVSRVDGEKPVVFVQRHLTAAIKEFLDVLTKEMNTKYSVTTTANP